MDEETNKFNEFEEALKINEKDEKIVMRLFVAGINPKSKNAIENLRELCKENIDVECEIEVIDIYQQPIFAKEGKIIAAPTLVKELPLPVRRFVGDLSDKENILVGLDIRKSPKK
jgi:circadian clock protein KaiB